MYQRRFIYIFIFIIWTGLLHGQQFFKSRGLSLFNRGEYTAAIDTMLAWSKTHSAERGIAYYYISECHYNLGIDHNVPREALNHFQESLKYLTLALDEPDLVSIYKDKHIGAKYKLGWCLFRMAELVSNPVNYYNRAYRQFHELTSSGQDSLSLFAEFMKGEIRLRQLRWERIQMALSPNEGQIVNYASDIIQHLREAERSFDNLLASPNIDNHLKVCARIRSQDVIFQRGKLYQSMNAYVFEKVRDNRKRESANQSAVAMFNLINYGKTLDGIGHQLKTVFRPVITYSTAYKYLNLYLLTTDPAHKYRLNSVLDSLHYAGVREEKQLMAGMRDHQSDIKSRVFALLADAETSIYVKAGSGIPEAWYWLGWVQFAVNNSEESEKSFQRFLDECKMVSGDDRKKILREDAQYRIFVLRFDRHADDVNYLAQLRKDIEAFHPDIPYIEEQLDFLLQLVRVGLGEPIWGRILGASTREQRLKSAFTLIRQMLMRATRVTGQERVPYLQYLDRLFRITEDRRTQETMFYRGLATFLRAEIQETANDKSEFYFEAADMLKSMEDEYLFESNYIRARSYFAAAKHESSDDRRNKVHERAKPMFISLINDAKSLRSVYYLGEIYRTQGNHLAALKCFNVVMDKTRGQEGGSFWYSNAAAGIQNLRAEGDTTVLNDIRIDEVIFPENLLQVDGEIVSLERFADADYARKRFIDSAISLYLKFGLPKKTIYPSVNRLQSKPETIRTFRMVTTQFQERLSAITSGLRLQVIIPEDIPQKVKVTLDGLELQKDAQGYYKKHPIPLNQSMEIRIENEHCYAFIKEHQFTEPGIQDMVVTLFTKIRLVSMDEGLDPKLRLIQFPERLDKNVLIIPSETPFTTATFLYNDFQSKLEYRDFVYIAELDRFLVTDSEKSNLIIYRNDTMVSKEGDFPLINEVDSNALLQNPEGIAVDMDGHIYVVDWSAHCIHVYNQDGRFIRSFGSLGENDPEKDSGKTVRFVYPTRIAIAEDKEGIMLDGKKVHQPPQIFVADRNGIHLLNESGIYWDTPIYLKFNKGVYYDIAVTGYGSAVRLFVHNRKTGRIEQYMAKSN